MSIGGHVSDRGSGDGCLAWTEKAARPKDAQVALSKKGPVGCYDELVIAGIQGRARKFKGVDLHVGNLRVGQDGRGRRIRPAAPSASGGHRTKRGCKERSCDDARSGIAGGGHGIEPATTHLEPEHPKPGVRVPTLKK